MPEHLRIEQHITSILRGSGLPMERRAQTAEEFRGHLRERVDHHRQSGLTHKRAVDAALAEFGRPEAIRGQLRRQQRALDRRYAAMELRRYQWLYLAIAGACGLVPIVLCPDSETPEWRFVGGLAVFGFVSVLAAVAGYLAALEECRICRLRPREEYAFCRSLLKWTSVVACSLTCLVVILYLAVICAVAWAFTTSGYGQPSPLHLVTAFGRAWLEAPLRTFGLSAVLIFGLALGAALFERSRCVDDPVPCSQS